MTPVRLLLLALAATPTFAQTEPPALISPSQRQLTSTGLFADLELVVVSTLAAFGNGNTLLAALATALTFDVDRLQVISAVDHTIARRRALSDRRELTTSYVLVHVGFEVVSGSTASEADLATFNALKGLLAVGFETTPAHVATLSVLDSVDPATGVRTEVATSSSWTRPTDPPDILPWAVPVSILCGLLFLFLLFLAFMWYRRRQRQGPSSAKITPMGRMERRGDGINRGEARSRVTSSRRRRARRGRQGDTEGEDDSDDKADDEADDEEVNEEELAAAAAPRSPAPRSPAKAPRSPGGAGDKSPRVAASAANRAGGRTAVSYEPPNAAIAAARCVPGPTGKPTYTLPPVNAATGPRRSAVPRSGFIDSAPPGDGTASLPPANRPPSLGPAPWLVERGAERGAATAAPAASAPSAMLEPPPPPQYGGAMTAAAQFGTACNMRNEARSKSRGNMRNELRAARAEAAAADGYDEMGSLAMMAPQEAALPTDGLEEGFAEAGGSRMGGASAPREMRVATTPGMSFAPKSKAPCM